LKFHLSFIIFIYLLHRIFVLFFVSLCVCVCVCVCIYVLCVFWSIQYSWEQCSLNNKQRTKTRLSCQCGKNPDFWLLLKHQCGNPESRIPACQHLAGCATSRWTYGAPIFQSPLHSLLPILKLGVISHLPLCFEFSCSRVKVKTIFVLYPKFH
jgi:hypothetical protein